MFSFRVMSKSLKINSKNITLFLFTLVILIRLIHLISTSADPFVNERFGDELAYHQWATEISNGELIRGRAFFTGPLYAYFLGFFYFLGIKSIVALRFINLIMAGASFWLIYLASRMVVEKKKYALIAPALFGLSSASIFYESFQEKTTLVILLTALSIYLILLSLNKKKVHLPLLAGLSSGLLALAHPLMLIVAPIGCLFILLKKKDIKKQLAGAILFGVGFILMLLPSMAHNLMAEGDLILTGSGSGQNFHTESHRETAKPGFLEEAERRRGRRLKSSETSSFRYGQGPKDISGMSGLNLKRFIKKVKWAIGDEEINDKRSFGFYKDRWGVLGLPLAGFGIVSLFGLMGIAIGRKEREAWFLSAFTLVYILVISLYFVYGRYRLPLIVPLSILASLGIRDMVRFIKKLKKKRLIISAILFFILSSVIFTKVPGSRESHFSDYFNMGNKYYNRGGLDDAYRYYELAILERPGARPEADDLFVMLVETYARTGEEDRARELITKYIEKNPHKRGVLGRIRTLSPRR